MSGFREYERSGGVTQHDLKVKTKSGGEEKSRVRVPILKQENMGECLAIDEKQIDGTCYTILSNRESNKIVMMAATLKTQELVEILSRIPIGIRYRVKSVTRDMAQNYDWLVRQSFANSYQVVDKFHVMKSAYEQVQSIRIRYRQEVLRLQRELEEKERRNKVSIAKASNIDGSFSDDTVELATLMKESEELKRIRKKLFAELPNGDTKIQLLARSRDLLFTPKEEWTPHQQERSTVLFKEFPEIAKGYRLIQKLRGILTPYSTIGPISNKMIDRKRQKLIKLAQELRKTSIPELKNIAATLSNNLGQITNYFYRKETNAKAEALN